MRRLQVFVLLSASLAANGWAAPAEHATCAAGELARAKEADRRLREEGTCSAAELALLRAAVDHLLRCSGEPPKPAAWIFPVAGVSPKASIGGRDGEGYKVSRPGKCFAIASPGHPAHDLFVDDPEQDSRDAEGRPFDARAVEKGVVLVANEGWKPGDPGKGGNYVVLLLPSRRQLAYYAHLDTVEVKAGEVVEAGQRLGTIGRTGFNAWPKRSPTHLHFALWDAKTFVPVDPYPLLRAAR